MNQSMLDAITESGPKPIAPNRQVANNWFWKFVPVDPLVFGGPNHDGSTLQTARQVYHRLLSRMVAERAHGMQLAIITAAWLVTVLLGHRLTFRGGGAFGAVLGLAAFGAFLFFVVPVLMRMAMPASAADEARAIVTRTFLRDLPPDTPADLRDELQEGWLTLDGRPLSSEISSEDGRTTEASRRTIWWILTAVAVGWAVYYMFGSSSAPPPSQANDVDPSSMFGSAGPGALGGSLGGGPFDGILGGLAIFSWLGSFVVLAILAIKLIRDKRPLLLRATELATAEAVEGAAFVAAGGPSWGTIPETARQRQIAVAASDPTPTFELGQTTGVFAGRGDFFGPNAGLPFRLSLRDLQMHMLVLGGTGSGKTSGILRPLARQVSAQQGIGLVVMDGKGSLPGELADLPGMTVIDPARADVSLVSGVEPAVIVDTIREVLAPSSGGQDAFWVNSAAGALRRGAIIAQAAGGNWWCLAHAVQVVSNKQSRDQIIDALTPKADSDPLLREAFYYFKNEWDTMDERTRSNILAEIRSWLSTITATPELLRWARTPAGADTVDLLAPLTGGRIGLLIPEYRYGVAGSVVTALLKARIYSALKSRAERSWEGGSETPIVFLVDEAQEVATTQDAQLLPIGRSLGLAMIAATQGVEGITAKLGEAVAAKWLSIFGTVIALGGRSPESDAFVAARAGDAWQLALTQVEGNTVRGSLRMEALSGPIAAARTQPHMARATRHGGWISTPNRLASAVAAARGIPGAQIRDVAAPSMTLGPRPLVAAGEIASLAAVPDTAIALATRGRVPRRDIVRLRPEYPTRSATTVRVEQASIAIGSLPLRTEVAAAAAR